jgi:hypothetical protein
MKASLASGTILLKARGEVGIPNADIVKFHPESALLFKEISERGWTWSTSHTKGAYVMEMKLSDAPCVVGVLDTESCTSQKKFSAVLDIGPEEPKVTSIEAVDSFRINIATPNCWRAVSLDYTTRQIVEIRSILWNVENVQLSAAQLKEVLQARDVLEWALSKGFKLSDEYPLEKCNAVIALVNDLSARPEQ